MCTWNGEKYLRHQLDSIVAQTRPPDELVICDDCSADGTREIVVSFAAHAPFPVRLHVNEQNLGSTRNFEQAISLCEGDVIALSDQDDVWLPEKLHRFEDCFLRNPKIGLVFTDAEVVDENLQPLGYRLWNSVGFDKKHRRLVRTGRLLDVLLPGWTVTGATMAFRSEFKDLVLKIPTHLALIHDGWIALMIASIADVSFIEEPMIKYRQHSRQQIGAKKRNSDDDNLGGLKNAMRRTNSYEDMIEIGTEARQRLSEHREVYGADQALSRLDARLKHLRTRSDLPNEVFDRARCVIRELFSRRYHLYSNGFRSAVKDLLA